MRGRFAHRVMLSVLPICQISLCLATEIPDANNTNIYYISPSGNDSHTGTTPQTTWQTISRVNTINLSPGDKVLFEGGKPKRAVVKSLSGRPVRIRYEDERRIVDIARG